MLQYHKGVFMFLDNIKQKITSVDIDKLLFHFGAAKFEDTAQYSIYSTICHNNIGEGSRKLYYYKDTKTFHCYTNCGSFDVFKFIENKLNLNFQDSVEYVCTFFGLGNSRHLKGFGVVKSNEFNECKEEEIILNIPTLQNKYILEIFQKVNIVEWTSEGISNKSIEKFNVLYYVHQNKIIIPHYSIDNGLVGIRGRSLNQEDIDNGKKYMPLFIGRQNFSHQLKHNLYGLNHTKKSIQQVKKAIVFEGEKSILLMDTYYGLNNISVAVCGSNFSKTQLQLLLDLGVEEIIFAFDKQYNSEISEQIWKMKMKRILEKINNQVSVTFIWDNISNGLLNFKDSPVDQGKHVFEHLLKNRISLED